MNVRELSLALSAKALALFPILGLLINLAQSAMDIQEIFNKDDVLSSIEELTELVVNKFDTLDSLVLMWETEDGQICHRNYGTSTDIVGLLAKGQYIIIRQTLGDTIDPKDKEM